ncbi:unnamed protein product [Clavelina lepadiformis]|uniref:Cytidyltransferase-like domain-containing protein n=2 Tax=Clavelina lepadiformis TaxID=159417 RepID=A0ABP0F4K3_CLALP
MAFEQRCPLVLVCCGSFNPITVGHLKMFEIARNFLERTGNHIVISGIVSPVHDSYGKNGLISSMHRLKMCRAAVQKHAWLSVDDWESSQPTWIKTVKVLQHVANKIKNDYGVPGPLSSNMNHLPARHRSSAVTLQPNGTLQHQVLNAQKKLGNQRNSVMCVQRPEGHQDDSLELDEASELDKTGVVFNRLSDNLQKVCCVRPVPLGLQFQDNMVYGAAYDLRRTKVMLLCGGDLLETFGIPGLWSDQDISEIVADYGIVCIPRKLQQSIDDDGKMLRDALDRLQHILYKVQGTVLLVNDQSRAEIANVSSTRCRAAVGAGVIDDARSLVHPNVLTYIHENRLYMNSEKTGG